MLVNIQLEFCSTLLTVLNGEAEFKRGSIYHEDDSFEGLPKTTTFG